MGMDLGCSLSSREFIIWSQDTVRLNSVFSMYCLTMGKPLNISKCVLATVKE